MANTLLFDEEFGGYLPQLEHFFRWSGVKRSRW